MGFARVAGAPLMQAVLTVHAGLTEQPEKDGEECDVKSCPSGVHAGEP